VKISIRVKLLLAYTAILSLLSIVWLIDYYAHTYLANEVNRMYTHPLAVTRASLRANSDIMAMHRSMKDVVLASNEDELKDVVAIVDDLEGKVLDEMIIVQKRILGEEGKKLAANTYKAFKDWRPIRQEVISLAQAGKVDEAIAITKGKGADHVRYLDMKAEQLWKYAENKGRSFNMEAQASVKSSLQRNILVFLAVILISFLLAIYMAYSISSRLKQLKIATRKISKGQLNQSVQVKGGDEIAELGEEFNSMAVKLYDSYSSLERTTGELRREISERKRAEALALENEERLRAILDNTSSVVYMKNVNGKYILINQIFENLFKISRKEIVDKTDYDIFEKQIADVFRENDQKVLELGKPLTMEEIAPHDDGLHTYISVKFPLLGDDGRPYAVCGISTDITERKKAEEALITAKHEAEEATKLKDKFVNLVAHDLRSPFTSILGTMNLLRNDPSLKLKPKQRELMNAVLESGGRMVSMIKEMLDISRLKTGKIKLKPKFFDGHIISGAVLGSISHLAHNKGIEIVNEVPEGARLYADKTLFYEVISNLLSNSVKFCGKGDVITLFSPPGRPTTIAVKDTGPGIGEKMAPDIFKSEVKTTTLGSLGELGTGLGLPYSHDIMREHGGDITVDSVKGEGSVFYAELPNVKPLILLVDDEKIVRQMLTIFLGELKVDIIEAENGREALKAIKEHSPHLIISDITMPEMDGYTLLEKIMGNEMMKSIPVIIVTSDGKLETREKVIRLGADDFISKPVKKDEFIPRIRKYII